MKWPHSQNASPGVNEIKLTGNLALSIEGGCANGETEVTHACLFHLGNIKISANTTMAQVAIPSLGEELAGKCFLSSTCLSCKSLCLGAATVRRTARVDWAFAEEVSRSPRFALHFVAKMNCL